MPSYVLPPMVKQVLLVLRSELGEIRFLRDRPFFQVLRSELGEIRFLRDRPFFQGEWGGDPDLSIYCMPGIFFEEAMQASFSWGRTFFPLEGDQASRWFSSERVEVRRENGGSFQACQSTVCLASFHAQLWTPFLHLHVNKSDGEAYFSPTSLSIPTSISHSSKRPETA
jgi:hypothetical protein